MASKNDKLTPAELRAENARLEDELADLKAIIESDPRSNRIYALMFREIARLRAALADIASGATFSDGKRGRTPKSRAKAALEG
jgi:predicted RNase H-like nuclease (RuvC/YqgF family)